MKVREGFGCPQHGWTLIIYEGEKKFCLGCLRDAASVVLERGDVRARYSAYKAAF